MSDADAVADCVRAHVAWFTARARSTGGRVWTDGPITWAWVPSERTAHALFPQDVPTEVIERGLSEARRFRAQSVAVWSSVDRARPELLGAGFEEGWQPWWVTASSDAGSGPLLGQGPTWRAEARVDGRYAGRAWIHLDGDLAGLFDMEVWPRFQRRGLGTELVRLLASTARSVGFVRVGEGRMWWWHRS